MALFNSALYNQTQFNSSPSGATQVVIPGSSLRVFNSTTYIDMLGLQIGLQRAPGETAPDFAKRVRRGAAAVRGPNYIGLLNEIALQFNLPMREGILIKGRETYYSVETQLGSLNFKMGINPGIDLKIATVSVDEDGFWVWKKLSDVVAELNAAEGVQATLLGADGPAFQIPRQSNIQSILGESIEGQSVRLDHPGFVLGTESFNQTVPDYSLKSDSILLFSSPLQTGAEISYKYQVQPEGYRLLVSEAFTFSLLDSDFSTVAVDSSGNLVYQAKEFIQEMSESSRSYWGK